MPEAAIEWWGKAGQRSLERSALVEAAEQITRALNLIAKLPGSPALRREEIKLQVALITPLLHIRGYAAPETKAAVQRARSLIEQAEELGEPPQDPLLLFSVLYNFWLTNALGAFNGETICGLAAQFLSLAEKQGTTAPLLIAHRMVGISALYTGVFAEARAHFEQAMALYDPAEHRQLATRFSQDARVHVLSYRSWALWFLGYPDAALVDAERALREARDIAQAATLMSTLTLVGITHLFCGCYSIASAEIDEVGALAQDKGTSFWSGFGSNNRGYLLVATGRASEAVESISAGIATLRSTGTILRMPMSLTYLARAYADLSQFDAAWRSIGEAISIIETTMERWFEAEINRIAGEIALMPRDPDAGKAEKYFERALALARQQQAKSWELRAAMSLARLWRHQGKPQQARELLAPVYGWFTEGFDTRDLKEAKALLDELHA